MLKITNKMTQLCLGSAQIGLDYGVSNKTGKINEIELKEILKIMRLNNINLIDTAKNYGNAEAIIGNNLLSQSYFDIVTKIDVKQFHNITAKSFSDFEHLIIDSLNKLKSKVIYGVLIHNPQILNIESSKIIIDWLQDFKEKGIIKKIGISIYKKEDLEIFNLDKIDIVQLPLSIYDQTLIKNDTLEILIRNNIDIHVRSIFLQGLILEESSKWPNFISDSLKNHHKNFSYFLSKNSISPIEATFLFLKSLNGIDSIIVGVSNKKELQDICKSWNNASKINFSDFNFKDWDLKGSKFLDPRNWP